MEILIAVAAKAAEYTVDPIKSGASSIFYPQAIIKETRKEFNQLQNLRNKVEDRCGRHIGKGQDIIENVDKWLTDSQATLDEVDQWLKESPTAETDTSNKCTRNWLWGHKQRKNAIRKKKNLLELFRQGENFSYISRPPAAEGILPLSGNSYIVYDSVKLAYNEINRALNDNEQSMIGVYGMKGIGKTSLVNEVCTKAKDKQLFNRVVKSVISRTVDIRKIQTELGDQLSLTYSMDSEIGRATQLKNRMMHEKMILVVLDDVWNPLNLKMIGIPFGDDHKGCKILLTTRQEHVCTKMKCNYLIKLKTLDDGESRDLFKRYAYPMLSDPPPALQNVAEDVIRECNGLPLALIVLASALRDKSQDEWEFALTRLQRSQPMDLGGSDEHRKVHESIKLGYDFLRLEVAKRLFLMCSLFPEDSEISVEVLTRYALGYGLFDQDTSIDSYMTAKTQVKIGIRNLLSHNLLLNPDDMSDCIKMHDVVRDAALWITSEGEEVFLVPIQSSIECTRGLNAKNAKVISLLACPENQYLPSPTEPGLEMLLLAQRKPLQNVKDNCFEMMITLRVLDMTSIATDPLELVLPSSLQNLSNLITLYLRRWILKGNMSIIGKLRRLEILSFAGSVLDKLPQELLDLSELKFFDLSACKVFDSEEVLGKLMSKLQKFYPRKNPCNVRPDSG